MQKPIIKRIVYSFWSKNQSLFTHSNNFLNPKFQLYSLALSVARMREYYDDVVMITDSYSKKIFHDLLHLPFSEITTDLDSIKNYNTGFWALGKVKAYQLQTEPFLHVDNDVMFVKKPDDEFMSQPIVGQSDEVQIWDHFYKGMYEHINKNVKHLPDLWLQHQDKKKDAICCALFGGTNIDVIQQYCKASFELIDKNTDFFNSLQDIGNYNVIIEQYLAYAACAANNIEPYYLLYPHVNKKQGFEKGYVHYWLEKRNPALYQKVEAQIKNYAPGYYESINRLFKNY